MTQQHKTPPPDRLKQRRGQSYLTSDQSKHIRVVTMETPVPGLLGVSGDVTAHMDDIIHGDRWVDQNRCGREETPLVRGHCDNNVRTTLVVLKRLSVVVLVRVPSVLPLALVGGRLNRGHRAGEDVHWFTDNTNHVPSRHVLPLE